MARWRWVMGPKGGAGAAAADAARRTVYGELERHMAAVRPPALLTAPHLLQQPSPDAIR